MEKFRIGGDGLQRLAQFKLAGNSGMAGRLQLRLQQTSHVPHHLVNVHPLELRLRHAGEFAEAGDDGLQVRDLGQ